MLAKLYRIFTASLLALILFLPILGCGSDDDGVFEPDTEPPAIPRGVLTTTGDERVTIEWFPNGERDLTGYRIWRSEDNVDFDLLEEVSSDTARYVDTDVINGSTYYYAVSAFDFDDNESDLSPEEIADTPRPAGANVTLDDFNRLPERSGFDFSRPDKGAIPWDAATTDVYFGVDTAVSDNFIYENVRYLYSDNTTIIQDMGYRDVFDAVDVSPLEGFVSEFVEIIEGHVYVLNTPDGNFAKIHMISVSDSAVTFDWAYQTDPDNPQLAPPAPSSE